MRREDNSSFRNYDFDVEKFQEDNKIEVKEVYVKPVDTSVAGLISRGAVADADLNYSEDLPPMDKMDLMEFHKMKQGNKDNVARLEHMEKLERELEEMKKRELENNIEPKIE